MDSLRRKGLPASADQKRAADYTATIDTRSRMMRRIRISLCRRSSSLIAAQFLCSQYPEQGRGKRHNDFDDELPARKIDFTHLCLMV